MASGSASIKLSIAGALAYKSLYCLTDASLKGFDNMVYAFWQDAIFARLAGRPW